jgi:uncharacterized membrane protein
LLADFITYRTALVVYWFNIFLLGLLLYASWGRATRAKLLKEDIPPGLEAAVCRRIMIAQALYAAGALLCVFNNYWSIGFIVLLELNYAFAPGFGRRNA